MERFGAMQVSMQLNKIYDMGLLVFRYFNPEMLHIMPIPKSWCSHLNNRCSQIRHSCSGFNIVLAVRR